MIVLVHHAAVPECRTALKQAVSRMGGRLTTLSFFGGGAVIEGLSEEHLIQLRAVPGVSQAMPVEWPEDGAPAVAEGCSCGGVRIGGGRITPIIRVQGTNSGAEQVFTQAREAGAVLGWLSAGAPGLACNLPEARQVSQLRTATSMGVVVPVCREKQVGEYADAAAGFHIPYWHMQNEQLLQAVGRQSLPVFLSRHPRCSVEEWIDAASLVQCAGNNQVVLVEEGVGGDVLQPGTMDIISVAHLSSSAGFPLVVAPGIFAPHDSRFGRVALGMIAAGADGIVIDIAEKKAQPMNERMQQIQRMLLDIEVLEVPLERELVRPPSRHAVPTTDTSAMNFKRSFSSSGIPKKNASAGGFEVAFQGERGAYSEAAMHRFFGGTAGVPEPCETFHDVFKAVLNKHVKYGVVPLENSLAGSVHENYDHFMQFPDIKIVGEVQIRIEHALIVKPGSKIEQIERVYSHPQGLAQCSRFLQQFPSWERVPFYDTAGSVQYLAESQHTGLAAIAGAAAAEVYGMEVIKQGIENNPLNFTRFAVIARTEEPDPADQNKASMVFSTPDKPGALLRCMNILAETGLNLKKIESRPIFGKPWQYRFYVDVDIAVDGAQLAVALRELPREAEDVRLIGCYAVV